MLFAGNSNRTPCKRRRQFSRRSDQLPSIPLADISVSDIYFLLQKGFLLRCTPPHRTRTFKASLPLSAAVFAILLSLAPGEKHGYAIMKDVSQEEGGALRMGPGTLYGSLDRLMERGLVEETGETDNDRRRYYRLTEFGRRVLGAETARLIEPCSQPAVTAFSIREVAHELERSPHLFDLSLRSWAVSTGLSGSQCGTDAAVRSRRISRSMPLALFILPDPLYRPDPILHKGALRHVARTNWKTRHCCSCPWTGSPSNPAGWSVHAGHAATLAQRCRPATATDGQPRRIPPRRR